MDSSLTPLLNYDYDASKYSPPTTLQNKTMEELTKFGSATQSSAYDIHKQLRVIQPDKDSYSNSGNNYVIEFKIPPQDLAKYIFGNQIDFVGNVVYSSATTTSTVLTEGIFKLFNNYKIIIGKNNPYVIEALQLQQLDLAFRAKYDTASGDDFVKSMLYNKTGVDWLQGVVRPFNFTLGSFTDKTGYRSLFDLVFNLSELSDVIISFELAKNNTQLREIQAAAGTITDITITNPRLIYWEYEDLQQTPVFSKIWDNLTTKSFSIPLTNFKRETHTIVAGSKTFRQTVSLKKNEQIKSFTIKAYPTASYEGYAIDRESQVLTGSIQEFGIRSGLNGDRVFYKEKFDTDDQQLQYYLKKSNRSFEETPEVKTDTYEQTTCVFKINTKQFSTLNTAFMNGTTEVVFTGEVVDAAGDAFAATTTLETVIEYEDEYAYDIRDNIMNFKQLD